MLLSKIKQFFVKNKKIFLYIGFFLALYYLFSETSFAADKTPKQLEEDKVNSLITWINTIMSGLIVLFGACTYFITIFLNPGWINGTIFGLNTSFKEIWILISNIVYFIFAGILIWIAFMNIIGGKGDNYELKKALPRFIIGVIIVPFSWFFVQMVLSVSGYLTMSFLTLPSDIFPAYETRLSNIMIPTDCTINFNYKDTDTATAAAGLISDKFFYCDKDKNDTLGDTLKNSSFGLISMYTYGILNLENIQTIYNEQVKIGQIKTILNLAVKIIFDFFFAIVYMVLFITLGIVLVTRGFYLWIYTMMSPVFGLLYFFNKKEGGGDGVLKKFNVKEFISLAFVPVYVMIALSFGLFFISTITNSITNNAVTSTSGEIVNINNDGKSISIGEKYKLTIEAPVGVGAPAGKSNANMLFAAGKTVGEGALGTIGSLLLYLLGIAVLRISIMAALRSSSITSETVEPIFNFGNQVGKFIKESPQHIPLYNGISMKGMDRLGSLPSDILNTKLTEKLTPIQTKAQDFFGTKGVSFKDKNEFDRILALPTIENEHLNKAQNIIKENIDKLGTTDSKVQEMIKDYAKKLKDSKIGGVTDEMVTNVIKDGRLSNDGAKMLLLEKRTSLLGEVNSSEAYNLTLKKNPKDKSGEKQSSDSTTGTNQPLVLDIKLNDRNHDALTGTIIGGVNSISQVILLEMKKNGYNFTETQIKEALISKQITNVDSQNEIIAEIKKIAEKDKDKNNNKPFADEPKPAAK